MSRLPAGKQDAYLLARTVRCPYCEAPIGVSCWQDDGKPRTRHHQRRYVAANRAAMPDAPWWGGPLHGKAEV